MKTHLAIRTALAMALTGTAQALPTDFKTKADALLKASYADAGPGAAVIVTDDGKVVYKAGQGLADIERKVAIAPDTVFRMGSITKQFSAAIVLQLAAEGRLSLDDRLSKFLPDYPKPGADATVAQLLNHTVGVQSYTAIPGFMAGDAPAKAVTTEQLIAMFKDMPSPSKPGERYEYNNSGYVLVGAVIEKVTGKEWHQAVEERIAKPLGLTSVRYGVFEGQTANMATGYTRRDGKDTPARPIHMSIPHAAGALIGTVEDLAKWNAALHGGKVIPAASHAMMVTPTTLPDGTVEQYGFGIGNRDVRGRKAVGHGGGIFGFSTDSIYLPEEDLFVAVFTNSDEPQTDPGMVMLKLAALAVDDPFQAFEKQALDAKAVDPWLGVYKVANGERRLFMREGRLFTQRSGGQELEAVSAGDGRYFYETSLTWFELKRDSAGTPVMAMYQQGAKAAEESLRTGPIPPEPKAVEVPRATLASYAGTYQSPIGTFTVALPAEGPMTVQLTGQPAIPVQALSESEFRAIGVDARIQFQAESGKITGLVLRQGGRELPAKRFD